MLLVCPQGHPVFHELQKLAHTHLRIPSVDIYRRVGARLLPKPTWDSVVFFIHLQQPRSSLIPSIGARPRICTVKGLIPCVIQTDLSWNHIHYTRDRFDHTYPIIEYAHRRFLLTPSALWDIRFPVGTPCMLCRDKHWPWECPTLLPKLGPVDTRSEHQQPTFLIHPFIPDGIWRNICHPRDPAEPGETSPTREFWEPPRKRPVHTAAIIHPVTEHQQGTTLRVSHQTGRGEQLLTCGDIEANPGPEPSTSSMAIDVDNIPVFVDLCHPSSASPSLEGPVTTFLGEDLTATNTSPGTAHRLR